MHVELMASPAPLKSRIYTLFLYWLAAPPVEASSFKIELFYTGRNGNVCKASSKAKV